MTDRIQAAFDKQIVNPNTNIQQKDYDALLEFPKEQVVKHEAAEDLTIVSTLYQEEFCEVLLVKSQSKNTQLVMKYLASETVRFSQDLLVGATDLATEAHFLSKLDHKNIVKLRGVCATSFADSYGQDGVDISSPWTPWRRRSRIGSRNGTVIYRVMKRGLRLSQAHNEEEKVGSSEHA